MDNLNSQHVKHLKSTGNDLRAIFEDSLTVSLISEPLISKQITDPAPVIRQFMQDQDFDDIGLTDKETVIGYVKREELAEGSSGQYIHQFSPGDLLADSTSLFQVLQLLRRQSRYFILSGNQVAGIVMRGDLQKAPVRMLLFSLVTIVEMNMLEVIQKTCPDNTWQANLNTGRLEKAQQLLDDRRRRNEDIGLADCLQLSDKFDLMMQNDVICTQLGYSKKKFDALKKKTNSLRDRLAHGQDLVNGSTWEEVLDTAEELETVLLQLEQIISGQPDRAQF